MSTSPWERPPIPPRQPGALGVQPAPPSWPKVFGVIAIVLGALGCLGGCWGAVSPLFIGPLIEMMGKEARMAGLEHFREWGPWITISSLLSLALAVLLLISGIGLLRRRRWAVGAGRCWAVLKMLFVIASCVFSFAFQRQQFDAMSQQNLPGMTGGLFMVIGVFTAVFTLLWGWALPVLLLVWFALPDSKREVADWH